MQNYKFIFEINILKIKMYKFAFEMHIYTS